MDEAATRPGPRDQPEIPQQPGTAGDTAPRRDADWTRNLTTIAVVPPAPRPAPEAPAVPEVADVPDVPDAEASDTTEVFEDAEATEEQADEPDADAAGAPASGTPEAGSADPEPVEAFVPEPDGAVADESDSEPDSEPEAEAAPVDDPDTALLVPVAEEPAAPLPMPVFERLDDLAEEPAPTSRDAAERADDELDAWVASLGAMPAELADKGAKQPDAKAEPEAADTSGGAAAPRPRRRIINPWVGGTAAVALLLVAATVVENPFTMATAQRVEVSDVPRMSDPEPPEDSGPVNGGGPKIFELPPVEPAAAPGRNASSGAPATQAGGPISGSPVPTRPFTLPPVQTPATVVTGSNGIPQMVLSAYQQAAATTAKSDPKCRLPWELLAAIGRVESGHANGGQVSTNGTTLTPILGPRLDGTGNTKRIADTDKGVLDFDREFDRAVGPMQFIPTSWKAYALDGNKDKVADPQNVFDAALTASRYLCAGDRDLATAAGLDRAIFSYNQSPEYVSSVKAWLTYYQRGVRPLTNPTTQAPASSPAGASKSPSASPSGSKAATSPKPTTSKSPSR